MRRRTLLLGAAAALVAGGCSRSGGTTSRTTARATIPPGTAPVACWALDGGSTPAGLLALRPPRLAVYRDGQVIADAAYRSDLPAEDVATLITRLADDLHGPEAAKRRDGVSPGSEAPTTVLTVRSTRGNFSARAVALDELRDREGYPSSLYDARDQLGTVHERVVSAGQPYTAERVRLVAEYDRRTPAEIRDWPQAVDPPADAVASGVHAVDLSGDAARNVVRSLVRDLDLNGAWPAYRTADGRVLCATWRYLLPDE